MNRTVLPTLAVVFAAFCAACGHKIGDSCSQNSDCATDGTRMCDTYSPQGGYCTIQGCDFGSCPDEAVCVRFFPALENAAGCPNGQSDCAFDEVCTASQQCALRSIEQRFCMLSCSSQDDCRDGYECRAAGLHGEPVPNPATDKLPGTKFCAARRTCSFDTDCETTEKCDPGTKTCVPRPPSSG